MSSSNTVCFIFVIIAIAVAHKTIKISKDEPRYVRTPHGKGWSDCIYEVESGSHIETIKGKTTIHHANGRVQQLEPCPMPFLRKQLRETRDSPDDGWQVWTSFNNNNNDTFTSFLGSFNVPQAPPNWDGGILYMFTGLQNDNWVPIPSEPNTPPGFDIIQPVLQYGGDSEDGGGNYWALASWYVTVDENVMWSPVDQVNAGDVIFGNMTMTGPTTWYISGIVKATGVNTSMSYTDDRLSTQPWAYCTLEVYEIDDCDSDFPPADSPMKFTGLYLTDAKGVVTPNWQALDNQADHCGATATVNSPSSVTITF